MNLSAVKVIQYDVLIVMCVNFNPFCQPHIADMAHVAICAKPQPKFTSFTDVTSKCKIIKHNIFHHIVIRCQIRAIIHILLYAMLIRYGSIEIKDLICGFGT